MVDASIQIPDSGRVKYVLLFLGLFAVSACLSRADAPISGLILYYPFPGDAFDSTASANNGEVFGATLAADRFGRANSAYYFSGQGDYIESDIPLPDSDSVTVSAWFELESWTQVNNWEAPQVLFFEGDDNSGHDLALLIGGGLVFVVKSNDGIVYKNWLPEVGKWTHVVCVADAGAKKMAIWVNGRKAVEGAFQGGADIGWHSRFNLGRRPGAFNDWHINGTIDEARVYDRALSDLEIAQLYSAESGTAHSLKISVETVRLTMGLESGKKYILQSSPDLLNWTDFGASFTATAAEQDVSVQVDEANKFWRVVAAPN
jgi:hypothetical protein